MIIHASYERRSGGSTTRLPAGTFFFSVNDVRDTIRWLHSSLRASQLNMVSKAYTLGGHLDSPKDLRSILGTMLSDKQLETLCDVVLIVDGERFPAHKAVLAAASKVFKAMFTREMKEKHAGEIVLSSLDPRSWRVAMQYIYTAQVDIDDEETALLVLSSARMYQLETLERFVESFLISRLNVCNCFDLLGHAERYDLFKLKEACENTMEEHFEEMAASPAFLQCPVELLSRLVQSGNLILKSEIAVFDAVMRWIQANEKNRMCKLDSMLQMVRVSEMDECELAIAGRNPMAVRSIKFRTALLESLLQRRTDFGGVGLLLSTGSHLKARKRRDRPFTFTHLLRGISTTTTGDEEEVVRTPWAPDATGKHIWRLKIYPHGYLKAKGEYLSVYVQCRSTCKTDELNVQARFDIFLVNRKDGSGTISFSSQHHFTSTSDHWGFHRYILLSRLADPAEGFISEETDSVVLGANVMF
jgi:BTB/POZ domain/BTB And C-terminal Kelch